jgi:ComF family protein
VLHPPPHAAAWVPFRYAFPVDRLIVGLKFAGRLERARLLGTLLAGFLAPRLAAGAARPAALVATPLHPARARQRGFNQAAEIARPVAAALGLPLLADAVVRVRATAEQSALDAAARRANLRDAFAVPVRLRAALPDHVAILDDVVTTGATAAALAAALRAAGVGRVTLIAVARAV